MNSSEVNFTFPVLGFPKDGAMYGFPDLDRLTKCGPTTIKDASQLGMELVDASLKRWRVMSVRRTGRAGSFLSLLWIFGPPQSRVELELEAMPAVTMDEVEARALKAMEIMKEYYYGEEGEKEYADTLKAIRRTKTVAKIYDLLSPDTFEAY